METLRPPATASHHLSINSLNTSSLPAGSTNRLLATISAPLRLPNIRHQFSRDTHRATRLLLPLAAPFQPCRRPAAQTLALQILLQRPKNPVLRIQRSLPIHRHQIRASTHLQPSPANLHSHALKNNLRPPCRDPVRFRMHLRPSFQAANPVYLKTDPALKSPMPPQAVAAFCVARKPARKAESSALIHLIANSTSPAFPAALWHSTPRHKRSSKCLNTISLGAWHCTPYAA